MKDFRGNEIVVGSTVVYAVKASTSCYIREGVVTAITDHPTWRNDGALVPILHITPSGRGSNRWKTGRRPVRVANLRNVVVVS